MPSPEFVEHFAVAYKDGELQAGDQGFGVIAVHGSVLSMTDNNLLRIFPGEVVASFEADVLQTINFSEADPSAPDDDYPESHLLEVKRKPVPVGIESVTDLLHTPLDLASRLLRPCKFFPNSCGLNFWQQQEIWEASGRIALCKVVWTGK